MTRQSTPSQTSRICGFTLVALGLLSITCTASAQVYRWTDASGRVIVSDTPPPAGKAQKILKPAPSPEPQKTITDVKTKSLDPDVERKVRERENQEIESEEKRKSAVAEYCSSAKAALAQLESGDRIARRSSTGERSFLTNEQRAEEISKLRKSMQDQKCP